MIGLDDILTRLVQRTEERKLQWSRTAEEGRFTTSVGAISVIIAEANTHFAKNYEIEILNESGETVETKLSSHLGPAERLNLVKLYSLARRSAHNVDEILEKLAESLDRK